MRVAGIDIGTESIKIVEAETAFKRFEILECHTLPVPQGANPLPLVTQILEGFSKKPDQISIMLTTGQSTYRNLHLPAKDKKSIQTAVQFEIEDDLPFDPDDVKAEFTHLNHTGSGSYIHVGIAQHSALSEFIANCQAAGFDPDFVTTEGWAIRTLLGRAFPNDQLEQPCLVVALGSSRSVIYGHYQGNPILCREIGWSGQDMTQRLAQVYQLPEAEAERIKIENGFLLSQANRDSATPDQIEFSDNLAPGLDDLFVDLRQALLTIKSIAKKPVKAIYLTGGASLTPGLKQYIEERLDVPIHLLNALSLVSPSSTQYSEETEARFSLAAGAAATLISQERSRALQFRKGEFAKTRSGGLQFDWKSFKMPVILTGSVVATLLVTLLGEQWVYRKRLEDADAALERATKAYFGAIPKATLKTYLADHKKLKSIVTKDLTEQREAVKLFEPNPHPPIKWVKALSSSIQRDIIVDLIQLRVGSSPEAPFVSKGKQNVELVFLVANPQVSDRLQGALSKVMTDVKKEGPVEALYPDGTTKGWKVTFSGQPNAGVYGK